MDDLKSLQSSSPVFTQQMQTNNKTIEKNIKYLLKCEDLFATGGGADIFAILRKAREVIFEANSMEQIKSREPLNNSENNSHNIVNLNGRLSKYKSLEPMMEIDNKIKKFSKQVKEISDLDNTKEVRQIIKQKIEMLSQLQLEAVTHLNAIASDFPEGSTTMKFCASRLIDIQNLQDDLAIQLVTFKKVKHLELAQPLITIDDPQKRGTKLSNLFAEGDKNIQAIKNYIKLGTEARDIVIGAAGNKPSPENEKVQKIFNSLIQDFDKVEVEIITKTNESGIEEPLIKFIMPNKKSICLDEQTFQQIDFSKIDISPTQLVAYEGLVTGNKVMYRATKNKDYFEENEIKNDGKPCQQISNAHKLAINVYTGNAFDPINNFMRGNIKLAAGSNPAILKEALLDAVVCTNALKKLDDYVPPNKEEQAYFWRGEGSTFRRYGMLQKYKDAVDQGGMYISNQSFTSSSYTMPNQNFFNENSAAGILIKGCLGKKIINWSEFGDQEREVVFPPMHLKINAYKEVTTEKNKTITFFIATPSEINPTQGYDSKFSVIDTLARRKLKAQQ